MYINAQIKTKWIRLSPFKLRRALDPIRGRTYREAITILNSLPYRGTGPIKTALQNLVSNMTFQTGIRSQDLYVKEAQIHHGPTLKRFRPCAKGRGFPIRRPMSVIQLRVEAIPRPPHYTEGALSRRDLVRTRSLREDPGGAKWESDSAPA